MAAEKYVSPYVWGELPDDEIISEEVRLDTIKVTMIQSFWGRIKKGDRFDSPRESEGRVEAIEDYGACDFDNRPGSVAVRQVGKPPGFFIAEMENCRVLIERITFLGEN